MAAPPENGCDGKRPPVELPLHDQAFGGIPGGDQAIPIFGAGAEIRQRLAGPEQAIGGLPVPRLSALRCRARGMAS